jgi:2-hydroxycyclohexanecarboxyl-CoA dehydrogenase
MSGAPVVIVTGGASGIGLGVSTLFAANGHPVAMLDLQEETLEREGAALRATGAKVLSLRVDIAKRDEIDSASNSARSAVSSPMPAFRRPTIF